VWDKVYTEAGHTRQGRDDGLFACHSEDLGGSGYAPALKGDDFAFAWGQRASGFLRRIRKLMPPDNLGSLRPSGYRDVIAFILQENKYPAGIASSREAALKSIKITAPPK
jgi:hypothetical protein